VKRVTTEGIAGTKANCKMKVLGSAELNIKTRIFVKIKVTVTKGKLLLLTESPIGKKPRSFSIKSHIDINH